jgi:Domain of unknown function (DUF4398)
MDYKVPKPLLYLLSVAFFMAFGAVHAQSNAASQPTPAFADAERALQMALSARADSIAATDFAQAQQALLEAKQLQAKRRRNEAERMALKAQRLAELALANTRYVQLKDEVDRKTTANAALRRELLMGRERVQP